jgi:hypothetical protein
VSLSILSALPGASITGDGTSASFLYLTEVPFLTFSMTNVTIAGFGDGSVVFPGAVVVQSLLGATFDNVQFGPDNVGYATPGALVLRNVSYVEVASSLFVSNSALAVWGTGGALFIRYCSNVQITNSQFLRNSLPGGWGYGGAVHIDYSPSVTMTGSSFISNSCSGGNGEGGAIYIHSSPSVSMASLSFMNNN